MQQLHRLITQRSPLLLKNVVRRTMATEKQLANQITSTKNIRKITASMKMVSAAKLKGDEQRLHAAAPFNAWSGRLTGASVELEDFNVDELPGKTLIVPFTSDKGLCGGVNSFISRGVRDLISQLQEQSKSCDIVVFGDKGRAQLRRRFGEQIQRSATEIKSPGNFTLAAALAQELGSCGTDYEAIVLVNNHYLNPAVYKQTVKVIKPLDAETSMMSYEFEPDTKVEVLQDMQEYLLTSEIFNALMDAATSEQSSRMAAMENASKNAGEMIDSLTLQYNRARQARITTELIEIISGASAIEG